MGHPDIMHPNTVLCPDCHTVIPTDVHTPLRQGEACALCNGRCVVPKYHEKCGHYIGTETCPACRGSGRAPVKVLEPCAEPGEEAQQFS